jgi:hypothetical protein
VANGTPRRPFQHAARSCRGHDAHRLWENRCYDCGRFCVRAARVLTIAQARRFRSPLRLEDILAGASQATDVDFDFNVGLDAIPSICPG